MQSYVVLCSYCDNAQYNLVRHFGDKYGCLNVKFHWNRPLNIFLFFLSKSLITYMGILKTWIVKFVDMQTVANACYFELTRGTVVNI